MSHVKAEHRSPTKREMAVAKALGDWLERENAKIVSERDQSGGRRLSIWHTRHGSVLVGTVDNRVAAVSVQVPVDDADRMMDFLECWARTGE